MVFFSNPQTGDEAGFSAPPSVVWPALMPSRPANGPHGLTDWQPPCPTAGNPWSLVGIGVYAVYEPHGTTAVSDGHRNGLVECL
jgi:hypothetical protein